VTGKADEAEVRVSKLEIAPEPSLAEREALERALAQLEQRRNGGSPAATRGAWWHSGLEDNVASGHGPAAK